MEKQLKITYAARQAVITKRTEAGTSAKAQAGSVRVSRDFRLNREEQHKAALEALVDKYGWHGEWVGSWIDNNQMAWVNTESVSCKCKECV